MCGAMVGTARCAVPARVVAGGTNDRVASAIRKSCAAARGADIAARCPYHAKHILPSDLRGRIVRSRSANPAAAELRLMSLAVPSPIGWERVRVRGILLEIH